MDLIRRQQAIDAAKDWYEGLICGSVNGLIKRLNALPTVQPEVLACGSGELVAQPEPQWIPVSERLPESETYCLFTVFEYDSELEATTIETVYGCFKDYGERRYWSWEDEFGACCIEGEEQLDGDHDEIVEKVLAWMPLPEAYKPNNK